MKLIEIDEIYRQRLSKLERLREETGYDPFKVDRYEKRNSADEIKRRFFYLKGDEVANEEVSVAGRIITLRIHGKAGFAHLRDQTGDIQLYFQYDRLGEEKYSFFKNWVDTGDIIGAKGFPFRTRRGELSVWVTDFSLLTKALRALPEKWHGLKDVETRYRQRYLDLIANLESRKRFLIRSKVIKLFREFLDSKGFIEVETPILQPIATGAAARPFVTYHNALDMKLYLRIAPELYLKRLLVGGFERIYEIGRNFRNEGISTQHNPEFTSLELYWAYANYDDMIKLFEECISYVVKEVIGDLRVEYNGEIIDFTPPWKRITMKDAIKLYAGIDFDSISSFEEAKMVVRGKGINVEKADSLPALMFEVFEELVEKKLIQPTFVIEYPVEVSPLAKRNPYKIELTDRFELFIGGFEIANAFSELNDPFDQKARFEEQARKREKGDEEAHPMDEDFVRALEYGMPPAAGIGIGIDRFVMILTGAPSIRDVILFPHLRPERGIEDGEGDTEGNS
ncbi:MAG: lysine--tRNA ligase [Synergistetes bacterium]|nr:lysine--tRNA ligase [Synergistota bacterium]MCX8127680.1 lysine--tRNA ligase [Synergistota bacterium]MDW8191405.1 lysine--tRNA ligase [Synergistota bacterium]